MCEKIDEALAVIGGAGRGLIVSAGVAALLWLAIHAALAQTAHPGMPRYVHPEHSFPSLGWQPPDRAAADNHKAMITSPCAINPSKCRRGP